MNLKKYSGVVALVTNRANKTSWLDWDDVRVNVLLMLVHDGDAVEALGTGRAVVALFGGGGKAAVFLVVAQKLVCVKVATV